MRSTHSDPQPWHLIPVRPGDDAIARRCNLVIISILALLVLGLLALALVPQTGSNASAVSAASQILGIAEFDSPGHASTASLQNWSLVP